jgi:protein subunit release factor A
VTKTVDERPMIPLEELRISAYPLRPPGGQQAGLPPMGVEIEHLPSGSIARCCSARSQHTNGLIASDMILAALTHPRFGK